jgi:large subunit ribosomal protein L22
MAYKSSYRYARISARKVRLLTALISGKSFEEAWTALEFSKKRAAVMVQKTLQTAAANAENEGSLNRRDLIVTEARVDEGPTLKRWQPKDRGRAFPIQKKTSHIHITVDEG